MTITPEKDATYVLLYGPLIYNYFRYLSAPEKKLKKKRNQLSVLVPKKKNHWMCLRCPSVTCCQASTALLFAISYYLLTSTNVLRMFDTNNIQALLLRLPMKFYAWFFCWGGGVTAVAGSIKAPICQRHQ